MYNIRKSRISQPPSHITRTTHPCRWTHPQMAPPPHCSTHVSFSHRRSRSPLRHPTQPKTSSHFIHHHKAVSADLSAQISVHSANLHTQKPCLERNVCPSSRLAGKFTSAECVASAIRHPRPHSGAHSMGTYRFYRERASEPTLPNLEY